MIEVRRLLDGVAWETRRCESCVLPALGERLESATESGLDSEARSSMSAAFGHDFMAISPGLGPASSVPVDFKVPTPKPNAPHSA